MDQLRTLWEDDPTTVLASAAALGVGLVASLVLFSRKKAAGPKDGELLPGEERDVVYFYTFDRWAYGANASSPCCKLETYLRLAKVNHKVVTTLTPHPRTKKTPYIRYNGHSVPDSNLIIDFLVKTAGAKDLDAHLSKQEKATLLAVRIMAEESLYFEVMHDRWMENTDKFVEAVHNEKAPPLVVLRFVFKYLIAPNIAKALNGQGTGRFTVEEIHERSAAEIDAFANILGEKDYFGGSKPSVADTAVFAILSGCLYNPWSAQRPMIEKYSNLVKFCERIKTEVYPDWDDISTGFSARK
ncbi:Failed axon connections-like [Hondaea fermentalgiana]|uniref:Failed axon connections-like n=1 Tax=Hondaea fermentalgiana TaxID=2315210 RepID=A0A2R5G0B7_9STRA|nr:Failed axon connections-like [Hondaea fermentalgiana]|eukprot:GBG24467.1 Failed axon connections-like [Hondaea fermentalgiana]